MDTSLLSVDWDYFIYTQKENWGSYIENNKNIINLWYKRYIQSKAKGKNIKKAFQLSLDVDNFWEEIKKYFEFGKNIKVYVSDSHALSYDIAKENGCNRVYLFDAHSDLGYGGLSSLNFEVNCANWLGKLLKSKLIEEANIISAIHICRSGAWTPPWFDDRFFQFIKELGVPYKIIDCPTRKWDTKNISFSDEIYYLMA